MIKAPDAAEVSVHLHFSTFSGQSLSHPVWINRWAPRSSSTFLQTRSLTSSPTEDQTPAVSFSTAGLPNASHFILTDVATQTEYEFFILELPSLNNYIKNHLNSYCLI